MTFNQAPYIEDAMNGFCMQQTTFPFVCCIMDDASTDGEPEVIKRYLQEHFDLSDTSVVRNDETDDYVRIFAQHKENKNCYFVACFLKYNHYRKKLKFPYIAEWNDHAKYVALCEGDDYWIHPQKLQLQAEYLDVHDEISLTCTRYNLLVQDSGKITLFPNYYFDAEENQRKEVFMFTREDVFLKGWITKTPTCMYRNADRNMSFDIKFKHRCDVHSVYQLLSKKNGACFSFVGSVYRKNSKSTFGGKSTREQDKQNFLVYKELYEMTHDSMIFNVLSKNSYLLNSFPSDFLEIRLFASHLIMRVKRKLRKSN
jgi:glycosyltransferase involved in cell wall biosynthesis